MPSLLTLSAALKPATIVVILENKRDLWDKTTTVASVVLAVVTIWLVCESKKSAKLNSKANESKIEMMKDSNEKSFALANLALKHSSSLSIFSSIHSSMTGTINFMNWEIEKTAIKSRIDPQVDNGNPVSQYGFYRPPREGYIHNENLSEILRDFESFKTVSSIRLLGFDDLDKAILDWISNFNEVRSAWNGSCKKIIADIEAGDGAEDDWNRQLANAKLEALKGLAFLQNQIPNILGMMKSKLDPTKKLRIR